MILATEIGDWRRFKQAGQMACYLDLVSREDSSGKCERRDAITEAGNSRRHMLLESGRHYHHRPNLSNSIRKRHTSQSSASRSPPSSAHRSSAPTAESRRRD